MKMNLVTALATSLFFVSSAAYVQAIVLPGDYNSLFGYSDNDFKVVNQGSENQTVVYDQENDIIGYSYNTYSGYYIGTVQESPGQGQGNPITIENIDYLISYFLGKPYTSDYFLKAENDNSWEESSGAVTLNVDNSGGTWSVTPSTYALQFYGVKGATEWALYFVDPALSSGTWSTEHLLNNGEQDPGLSHFAGSVTTTTAPIPEPTALILFGSGLLGLAGFARRKRN